MVLHGEAANSSAGSRIEGRELETGFRGLGVGIM